MLMRKWNYKEGVYKDYIPPCSGEYTVFADLTDEINCAACGKKLAFGDAYTSKIIHDGTGFGYAICQQCSEEEWKEEMKYDKQ